MRLDATGALLFTELDHRLKDLDDSLDACRLVLALSDQLEAARVEALQDWNALIFKSICQG